MQAKNTSIEGVRASYSVREDNRAGNALVVGVMAASAGTALYFGATKGAVSAISWTLVATACTVGAVMAARIYLDNERFLVTDTEFVIDSGNGVQTYPLTEIKAIVGTKRTYVEGPLAPRFTLEFKDGRRVVILETERGKRFVHAVSQASGIRIER